MSNEALAARVKELELEIMRERGAAKRTRPYTQAGRLRVSKKILAKTKTILRQRGVKA
jgi:ribosomal protein L29